MNRLPFRPRAAVLAALAAVALAAPVRADEPPFEVAQPYEGTWYGRFGPTNCSWIDTGDGVFVIDTGATGTDAKNLKAEIARTTKGKPIRWIAMTHLHSDSNDGFAAFLPTDATVIVNAKAIALTASAAGREKVPHVLGVTDRVLLAVGKHALEIGVPAGNAHTPYDLWVYDAGARTAWVGDLVTPGRCPMLSDPDSDLKGWLAVLAQLDALKPAALVPTRGNPTTAAAGEIDTTRQYLTSLLQFLVQMRKQKAAEARVAGELAAQKIGGYCPRELSSLNALSVYRRLSSDGTTVPGASLKTAPPK